MQCQMQHLFQLNAENVNCKNHEKSKPFNLVIVDLAVRLQ